MEQKSCPVPGRMGTINGEWFHAVSCRRTRQSWLVSFVTVAGLQHTEFRARRLYMLDSRSRPSPLSAARVVSKTGSLSVLFLHRELLEAAPKEDGNPGTTRTNFIVHMERSNSLANACTTRFYRVDPQSITRSTSSFVFMIRTLAFARQPKSPPIS